MNGDGVEDRVGLLEMGDREEREREREKNHLSMIDCRGLE